MNHRARRNILGPGGGLGKKAVLTGQRKAGEPNVSTQGGGGPARPQLLALGGALWPSAEFSPLEVSRKRESWERDCFRLAICVQWKQVAAGQSTELSCLSKPAVPPPITGPEGAGLFLAFQGLLSKDLPYV